MTHPRHPRNGGGPLRSPSWIPACAGMTLSLLLSISAFAVEPNEMLPDAQMEARARSLSQDLRCMVCQGQAIDDSDAALARDIRLLVRERLKAGDSDAQVLQYLKDRYGDFILLKPPVENRTLPLWLAPLAVLGLGLAALSGVVRKHRGRE